MLGDYSPCKNKMLMFQQQYGENWVWNEIIMEIEGVPFDFHAHRFWWLPLFRCSWIDFHLFCSCTKHFFSEKDWWMIGTYTLEKGSRTDCLGHQRCGLSQKRGLRGWFQYGMLLVYVCSNPRSAFFISKGCMCFWMVNLLLQNYGCVFV